MPQNYGIISFKAFIVYNYLLFHIHWLCVFVNTYICLFSHIRRDELVGGSYDLKQPPPIESHNISRVAYALPNLLGVGSFLKICKLFHSRSTDTLKADPKSNLSYLQWPTLFAIYYK